MRTAFALAFALLAIGAADLSVAHGQSAPAEPAPAEPTPAEAAPDQAQGSKAETGFAPTPAPPTGATEAGKGQVVIQSGPYKPSGFWTSGRPARGGAYRYGMLLVGALVAVLALGLLLWVLRRSREEDAPARPWPG